MMSGDFIIRDHYLKGRCRRDSLVPVLEEYRGSDSHVQIPSGVIGIGVQAFSRCACVERITLPGGIQFIEAGAFEYCTNLRTVIMARGLKRIDEQAFYGCVSLTDVQMPPGISIARSSQREDFCNPPMEMEPFRYTIHIHGAFEGTPFGKRHGFA